MNRKDINMKINKEFYKSKTMWVSLLTALVPNIFPEAQEFIQQHPDYIALSVGVVFALLRVSTKQPVGLK